MFEIDEKKTRADYVAEAPIGSIVAFVTEDGKYKSAKIINRSSKRSVLKLRTSYGKEFQVPYQSVLWVKSGERWPRGIYNLLKGKVNEGSAEDGKTYRKGGSAVAGQAEGA